MSHSNSPSAENQPEFEGDDITRLIEEVTATMLGGEPSTSAPATLSTAQPEINPENLLVRLPDQHRHALQNNVSVRWFFGAHGWFDVVPGHGVASLGASEKDYADAAAFIDQLDPQHGDILCLEAAGFDEDFSPDKFLQAVAGFFFYSKHTTPEDLRAVLETGSSDTSDKARAAAAWEKARKLQILGPFQYVTGLAINKGLEIVFADATAHEYDADSIPMTLKGLDRSIALRDPRTIECLGRIAYGVSPPPDAERKPILGVLRGRGHRKNMERLLRKEDIPFTTDVKGASEARLLLRAAVDVLIRREVDPVEHHRKKWLANLPEEP